MKRLVCLVVWLCVPAAVARANGNNTHVWISEEAITHLPDGDLKTLLSRPENRQMLLNGTFFPDGGSVIGDDYGEMAHWEPFVNAYKDWIVRTFPKPLTRGEAAQHVAFLMGVASHGMADQVFDSMFMKAGRVYDAAGWSDDTFDSFDTASDALLVAETQRFVSVEPWVPPDMSAFYRDQLAHTISNSTLNFAQELLAKEVLGFPQKAAREEPDRIAGYRTRYPWMSAHLMSLSEAGAPACEGGVVAAYWLALWDRLHGVSGQQNFVIATVPADGVAGQVTDHSRVESQLVVIFGHGMASAPLAGAITVTDDTGATLPIEVRPWSSDFTNVVRLVPAADWPRDRELTVTVAAGLTTIDGVTLEQPFSWRVSTASALDGGVPYADPTPHMGQPVTGEVDDAGGCGCHAGARRGGRGWLVALLAMVIAGRAAAARATGRGRGRGSVGTRRDL